MTRVAITMRVTNAEGYDEPRDSISHDWLHCMTSWGMTPVPVPNTGADAVGYMMSNAPDLLILSGGEDLGTTPVRDETERVLLQHAMSTGLPVFGVCRGLQLINIVFGGRLGRVDGHIATSHRVHITDAWQDFYGSETEVNSYHNTAIDPDGLASELVATAHDETGMVEAARHASKALAAVMWHPERNGGGSGDRALIHSLIERGTRP